MVWWVNFFLFVIFLMFFLIFSKYVGWFDQLLACQFYGHYYAEPLFILLPCLRSKLMFCCLIF